MVLLKCSVSSKPSHFTEKHPFWQSCQLESLWSLRLFDQKKRVPTLVFLLWKYRYYMQLYLEKSFWKLFKSKQRNAAVLKLALINGIKTVRLFRSLCLYLLVLVITISQYFFFPQFLSVWGFTAYLQCCSVLYCRSSSTFACHCWVPSFLWVQWALILWLRAMRNAGKSPCWTTEWDFILLGSLTDISSLKLLVC